MNTDIPQPKSSPMHPDNDAVLIVGGGHVGLSFALMLAYHGIASIVIEKNKYPSISPDDDRDRSHYLDSRNTALSRRTVQIYQKIGLWQQLNSHACRIDEVHISELGGFGHAKLIKEEEGVESFGYVMENAWLSRVLLLAVLQSELITLIDDTKVTSIQQNKSAVTIDLTDNQTSNQTQQTAKLLVACDGRDSTIRQLLAINTTEYDYHQSAIVGIVTTDQPHHHVGIERFSPAGPLALLPLISTSPCVPTTQATSKTPISMTQATQQEYRRSVVWICPKGDEKRYLQDDRYFLQTLQETFGTQAGRFLQAGRRGAYPLSKVLAHQQVKGRCVIMGNSAHSLHPVAGQGFNLCMRDADTLAKLLKGQLMRANNQPNKSVDLGYPPMLQTYVSARQTDQQRVIKFCDTVVHGFDHPSPVVKFARNVGLLMFDKVPTIKPLVATYAMGLKT